MAIVSPAFTVSPSRTRTSRMRPVVLEATAESSPSIRPLTTTMLFGIGGAAKKIFQIRNAAAIRTTPATIIRIRRRRVAACFVFSSAACLAFSSAAFLSLSAGSGLALSAAAGFAPGGSVCFFCSACSVALSAVGVVICLPSVSLPAS